MAATEHTTSDLLASMLTENTGKHFLDSGGAYGRAWQQNRENHPQNDPTYEVHDEYVLKNVYHHLAECLRRDVTVTHKGVDDEYDRETHTLAELEAVFYEWANSGDRERDAWLTCMRTFAGMMDEGEGAMTTNTYNYDSDLSQVLQYTTFEVDGRTLVFMQIHGGCDVRGGYTKPRLFEVDEYELYHDTVDFWCRNCGYDAYNSYTATDDGAVFNEEEQAVYCPECQHELSMM